MRGKGATGEGVAAANYLAVTRFLANFALSYRRKLDGFLHFVVYRER